MDISNSEAESINKSTKKQSRPESRNNSRTFPADDSDSSESVSPVESLQSVPSLCQASATRISPPEDVKPAAKLAFTTEELEFNPNNPHPRSASRPSSSIKRGATRHGIMSANTSNVGTVGGPSAHRSKSYVIQDAGNNPPIRARPTVTTILRQQHVLERVERQEKEKMDSLMISNSVLFESGSVARQKEKKDTEEIKAAEAKRLLQAKLAYERAKAASRKVIDEKQRIADETRQKEKEWEAKLIEQRKAEVARRKYVTENLQKSFTDSKRAFKEMLRLKQIKATQLKVEMENLHLEAKQKKRQDDMKRQDRIQQIQASKLALKKTKGTMGNPNQFYRSIAIPETQIKLRLQREEENRKLEDARKKIQAEKQMKSVKLIRAMKKIQSFETMSRKQAPPETPQENPFLVQIQKMNNSRKNSYSNTNQIYRKHHDDSDSNRGEINEMLQELNRLKEENCLQKQNEEQYRKGKLTLSTSGSMKVIGASNIPRGSDSSNNNNISNTRIMSSGYYDHIKHGVHTPFNKGSSNNSTVGKI